MPETLAVWEDEDWYPAGKLGLAGYVVYSNRIVLASEILFSDTATALLTKGWQLTMEETGTGYVYGEFAKHGRLCLVWSYSGSFPGDVGGADGTKMFISYE